MTYWTGDNVLSSKIDQVDVSTGRQTALVHACSSPHKTTLLSLHNYWSWNYGLQAVKLAVELRDKNGVGLLTRELEMAPDGSTCVDVRDWLADIGVVDFEGVAAFRIEAEGLNPENPVQLIADYLSGEQESTRSISSVHGQGAETPYLFSQRMHTARVYEDPEWSTQFVVLGHYMGTDRLLVNTLTVELFNSFGKSLTAQVSLPPRGGLKMYRVSDVFENASEHLRGKAGHLKVTSPFKMHRLFYVLEHLASETTSVNHATVDHNHNYEEWSGIPPATYAEMGCYPTVVAPVIIGGGLSSGFFLSNTAGPPAETRTFRVDVYPSEGAGEPVFRRDVTLSCGECVNVDFSEWLGDTDFIGQAVAWIPWNDQATAFPRQIDWLPFVRSGQHHSASTHVGSAAYNVQGRNEYFRPLGTRLFARMLCDINKRSELILTYPTCGHDSDEYAETQVQVFRKDGRSVGHTLTVPRNGCVRLDLLEAFEDVRELLDGESSYTVRCQDRNVRLVGFHLTRVSGGSGISMDHLVGG